MSLDLFHSEESEINTLYFKSPVSNLAENFKNLNFVLCIIEEKSY